MEMELRITKTFIQYNKFKKTCKYIDSAMDENPLNNNDMCHHHIKANEKKNQIPIESD